MEMKHTPGPWWSNGRSIKRDYQQIGLSEDSGETIAAVMGGKTSGPHFVEDDAECEANARLIAAAPELLGALEGLVGDIHGLIAESYGVEGLHQNGDIAPWEELEEGGRFERLSHLTTAITAIAKATGG